MCICVIYTRNSLQRDLINCCGRRPRRSTLLLRSPDRNNFAIIFVYGAGEEAETARRRPKQGKRADRWDTVCSRWDVINIRVDNVCIPLLLSQDIGCTGLLHIHGNTHFRGYFHCRHLHCRLLLMEFLVYLVL